MDRSVWPERFQPLDVSGGETLTCDLLYLRLLFYPHHLHSLLRARLRGEYQQLDQRRAPAKSVLELTLPGRGLARCEILPCAFLHLEIDPALTFGDLQNFCQDVLITILGAVQMDLMRGSNLGQLSYVLTVSLRPSSYAGKYPDKSSSLTAL